MTTLSIPTDFPNENSPLVRKSSVTLNQYHLVKYIAFGMVFFSLLFSNLQADFHRKSIQSIQKLNFQSKQSFSGTIFVMCSGGFSAALKKIKSEFETKTNKKLFVIGAPSLGGQPNSIPSRLGRNEYSDVVILAKEGAFSLIQNELIYEKSVVDIASSKIGLAVKEGALVPNISSVPDLRSTLLSAKSIAYSESASGIYIERELFKLLGIEVEMEGKAFRVVGEFCGDVVARGDAEIGFQQMSELIPIPGITVVGPIPDEVQKITIFSGAIPVRNEGSMKGKELLKYLTSKIAFPEIKSSGMTPIIND